MGWFRRFRKRHDPPTPEEMLAQGHAAMAQPASPWPADLAGPPAAGDFRMQVEDVFQITGRGLVATGRIQTGLVQVGQHITITRAGGPQTTAAVDGIEQFRKTTKQAVAGDNVGLLFRDLTKQQLAPGDVLTSS